MEDDSYRAVTNHYGRYKDKEDIMKFALQYEEKNGIADKLTDAVSNRHKALANMYRELVKGKGQNYSDNLIREIYNYIHKCNEEIQKDIDDKNSQTYLTDSDKRYLEKLRNKLRDEKVFDKYNFLFKKQESCASDNDVWGEHDSMQKDFSIDEISDMPTMSANSTKVITIKKPMQKKNMSIPDDVIIQRYADNLYKEYGSEYEKSLFLALTCHDDYHQFHFLIQKQLVLLSQFDNLYLVNQTS